jgi:hypothetical protein
VTPSFSLTRRHASLFETTAPPAHFSHADAVAVLSLAQKYGVELVRFTHHEQCVLCTSRPPSAEDYAVRYLSLYDNQYLRFFAGHQASDCIEPPLTPAGRI